MMSSLYLIVVVVALLCMMLVVNVEVLDVADVLPNVFNVDVAQKHSRRLWRSQRRKSRSVPEAEANFPAAIFLAGKCPSLGRDSILRCRKIGE